jgi:hypothetical protein
VGCITCSWFALFYLSLFSFVRKKKHFTLCETVIMGPIPVTYVCHVEEEWCDWLVFVIFFFLLFFFALFFFPAPFFRSLFFVSLSGCALPQCSHASSRVSVLNLSSQENE